MVQPRHGSAAALLALLALPALAACGPSTDRIQALATAGAAHQVALVETARAAVEVGVEDESWDLALGLSDPPSLSGSVGEIQAIQLLGGKAQGYVATYQRLTEVSAPLADYFAALQTAIGTNQGEALATQLNGLSGKLGGVVQAAGRTPPAVPGWIPKAVDIIASHAYEAAISAQVKDDVPLLVDALGLQNQIVDELIRGLEVADNANVLVRLSTLNQQLAAGTSMEPHVLVDARVAAASDLLSEGPGARLRATQEKLNSAMTAIVEGSDSTDFIGALREIAGF